LLLQATLACISVLLLQMDLPCHIVLMMQIALGLSQCVAVVESVVVAGGSVPVSAWLNMELDLQSLFGLLCTAVLIG
jgi:hypothetical protein